MTFTKQQNPITSAYRHNNEIVKVSPNVKYLAVILFDHLT